MGELRILDPTHGDLKVIWDPNNENEVEAARNQFNELLRKGHQAFAVDKVGEKAKEVKRFDPEMGKVILSPPVKGG